MKQSLFMMGLLCGLMTFVGCAGVSVNSIENANKNARMRIIADARVEMLEDAFQVIYPPVHPALRKPLICSAISLAP
jgi:hypothetical protein